MLVDSLDTESDRAQRLERMKCEFLVAQQRRRVRMADAADAPDTKDAGTILRTPDGGPAGIAPVAELAQALTENS